MAMLAGPRQKQRVINLRAKNNAWSNDKNKFGQRMLEKMGWSEGRGLGAKENGMTEHVVARFKNDERGLGYEDKNDQWTKHEDDFNTLLANLSNGETSKSKLNDSLHSGKSLEIKSKKSKARIHYHKFTRGKDLSQYSEKDLANIFGKKTLKSNNDEKLLSCDDDNSEKVFSEKGSMYDYFKTKLASIKTSSKLLKSQKDDENIPDHCFEGFSNTVGSQEDNEIVKTQDVNTDQPFSFYNIQEQQGNTKDKGSLCLNEPKECEKKSKKRKHKQIMLETLENIESSDQNPIDLCNIENQKKKKSKKKSKKDIVENTEDQETTISQKKYKSSIEHDDCIEPTKKKKKKNKTK